MGSNHQEYQIPVSIWAVIGTLVGAISGWEECYIYILCVLHTNIYIYIERENIYYTHIYMYVCTCIYVCACICTHVYIHTYGICIIYIYIYCVCYIYIFYFEHPGLQQCLLPPVCAQFISLTIKSEVHSPLPCHIKSLQPKLY